MSDLISPLSLPDDDALRRLHARLETEADGAGLLEIAYRTLETPVGLLLLAATPRGLVRVAFRFEGHDAALERLARELSPRILCAPRRLDAAAREIDEYFAGRRVSFDLPLDLSLARGFRRKVLGHLARIRYGATASYAQIARHTGSPRAVRAVGTACALNPLPIVVPCHRVLRSDGSLGGYAGGLAAKRALLALEASAV